MRVFRAYLWLSNVLRSSGNGLMMSPLRAGVAKLVYAPDSKSGEVHSSCRFESDLRQINNPQKNKG
jgi:hypothetical protein